MARRTKVVTIDSEKSRDHGKTFLITEMSADALPSISPPSRTAQPVHISA